jgi:aspartyl-tRNA(Asn)/glutamyl-tRNA(Gln) amidotransferase subunit B
MNRYVPQIGFERASELVFNERYAHAEALAEHGIEFDAAAAFAMNHEFLLANAREVARLVEHRQDIPRKAFDDALAHAGDESFSAEPYLAQKAVADTSALEPIVDDVIAANGAQVEQYRAGKTGLLGFFVGQVMKKTNGTADARVVNELVRSKLDA